MELLSKRICGFVVGGACSHDHCWHSLEECNPDAGNKRATYAAEVFGCAVCPAQPRRRNSLQPELGKADSGQQSNSTKQRADSRSQASLGALPIEHAQRPVSETRKGLRRTGCDVEDAAVPCPRRELDMVRYRSRRRKPQLRGAAGARAFEALEASRLQVEHPAPETMLVS